MTFLCSIPVLGLLFNACLPPPPLATGYVEGEYVLIAPIETAQIAAIPVSRGDRIHFDQPLVLLERRDTEIATTQAEAALLEAKSKLANISQGARSEKIATLQATLKAARFNAEEARRNMERQIQLNKRGTSSDSRLEHAQTAHDVAKAKVAELQANLAYIKLPARKDEIAAAKASVKKAEAALAHAQWRHTKRTLKASQSGYVVDVIRDLGEVAGPQAPVLSILPENGVKLRLYLPERELSSVSIGSLLTVECDGCKEQISARVSYISEGPEFTPPVIYSLENRQKLVYLIEARPISGQALKPGQIISVQLKDRDDESH